MLRNRAILVMITTLLVLGSLGAAAAPSNPPDLQNGRVSQIIDAHQFIVSGVGPVRLLGVQLPPQDSAVAALATAYVTRLIGEQQVYVRIYPANLRYSDGFYRAVMFVYSPDGKVITLNTKLLAQGLATLVHESNPSTAHWEGCVREAQRKGLGMWGMTGR